jgi:L-amino acid N-acyltransferase YncA
MRYPKEVVLNDGTDAVIRPLVQDDGQALKQFYVHIPDDDRWFMHTDPFKPETLSEWLEGGPTGDVYSIVAVVSKNFVAHASLYLQGFGATRHVGLLRIMVASDYRHKRLGTWMLLDLIRLAMDKGLRDLRADFVVGIENGAIEAAHKLDFFKMARLEKYVRDPAGGRHDLQIMVKRLHKDWSDY